MEAVGAKGHRQELRDALWSVHFHAAGHPPFAVPRAFVPMSLGAAVDILLQKRDEHDTVRRHWARSQLQEAVDKGCCLPLDRKPAQALITRCKKEKAPKCLPQFAPCNPRYNLFTRTTTVQTSVTVTRPLAKLTPALDPRSWAKCSPFFDAQQTFQIRCDGNGGPIRKQNGEYEREARGPKVGAEWHGLLHEQFEGTGVSFGNVLQIDFEVTAKKVHLKYNLYIPESCTIAGFSLCGGLLKDSGNTVASPVPGNPRSTKVVATKTLRFRDFTPGDPGGLIDYGDSMGIWAPLFLCLQVQDKAAFDLCCEP